MIKQFMALCCVLSLLSLAAFSCDKDKKSPAAEVDVQTVASDDTTRDVTSEVSADVAVAEADHASEETKA